MKNIPRNRIQRPECIITHLVFLVFVLLSVAGCTSNATRLASLKANYNEGKWDYVLGTAQAKGTYSADNVIKAAGSDTLTADQAKLIKARALMHAFITDKMMAANAGASTDPDVQTALRLIKELLSKDIELNWMKLEIMASIADYLYMSNNYPSAFDAYDYLLNHSNFESLDVSYRQYLRRWVEMKRQLPSLATNDAYSKSTNEKFKGTYDIVVKKFPDDIGTLKAGIMLLDDEGNQRAAIQRAMLAHFIIAKNPKTQKRFTEEINDMVESILRIMPDSNEKERLKEEYKQFLKGWDASVSEVRN